jgi:hypothetical protein
MIPPRLDINRPLQISFPCSTVYNFSRVPTRIRKFSLVVLADALDEPYILYGLDAGYKTAEANGKRVDNIEMIRS